MSDCTHDRLALGEARGIGCYGGLKYDTMCVLCGKSRLERKKDGEASAAWCREPGRIGKVSTHTRLPLAPYMVVRIPKRVR